MITTIALWISLATAAADAPETSTRLARVPDGMAILHDLLLRNCRHAFDSRASIAWSEDGRVVAYVAQRGDDVFPVVGEKVGEPYGHATAPVVAGGRVFFHVMKPRGEDRERHWLWIDGKTIGPEDWMTDPAVRSDGKQASYWTHPGAKVGDSTSIGSQRNVLAQATEKGGSWAVTRGEAWVESGSVRYVDGSPNAFAHGYARNQGWIVFRAEKKEPRLSEPCESIESFDVAAGGSAVAHVRTVPPRGGHSAFLEAADEPRLFFKGRRVGARHAIVSTAVVDRGGAHVAYVVTRDGKRSIAVDDAGEPAGSYDFVIGMAFDPSGSRLAAVVVRGGRESATQPGVIEGGAWSVVVHDVAGREAPKELPDFQEVRDVRWDARGERIAYAARDELGWRVVCGDLKSAPHSDVGPPVFSADGRRIGFGSRDARELWWREIDAP